MLTPAATCFFITLEVSGPARKDLLLEVEVTAVIEKKEVEYAS